MSRIAFVLSDLAREVREIAPSGPAPVIILGAGSFRPVVDELANHFGAPAAPGITEYAVGHMLIRQAKESP